VIILREAAAPEAEVQFEASPMLDAVAALAEAVALDAEPHTLDEVKELVETTLVYEAEFRTGLAQLTAIEEAVAAGIAADPAADPGKLWEQAALENNGKVEFNAQNGEKALQKFREDMHAVESEAQAKKLRQRILAYIGQQTRMLGIEVKKSNGWLALAPLELGCLAIQGANLASVFGVISLATTLGIMAVGAVAMAGAAWLIHKWKTDGAKEMAKEAGKDKIEMSETANKIKAHILAARDMLKEVKVNV
jgi:hypothetical protein